MFAEERIVMNQQQTPQSWRLHLFGACLLAVALSACGGGGGGSGTAPPPGGVACGATPVPPASVDATTAGLTASTALNFTINAVCIDSPPVVTFTVTNQAGTGMAGLTASDVRFNIAKLEPISNGNPTNWQNYINRASGGAVQGSQERMRTGFPFGTLTNNGNGTYVYTFATDITNPAANPCPAPCTDADGKPLNISYEPGLTHRVTIQQGNSAYPKATGVLDFVPNGTPADSRDIVLTSTCNTCHNELTVHGTRVDTRLCVTCHNPGSWVAGTPNTTVDFKVMIHRIHYNIYNSVNTNNPAAPNYLPRELPSVAAGYPYTIGSADFSDPTWTQDARNCERCHNSSLSAQGGYWRNQPNMQACGSCHDNVYFGIQPDPAKPYQTVPHSGGVQTDNSTCFLCHGTGKAVDVAVAHDFTGRFKAAAAKFQFNIISAAPTTPGSAPVVTFSVTDPTNGNAPYDIMTDPAFTAGSTSSLSVKLGWTAGTRPDIGNDGNGQDYGQPISINALNSAVAGATPGTYTVTFPAIPLAVTGTMRVMMDGHPAGDVTTPGTFQDRLAVTSAFKDFAITGTVMPRRVVVAIQKCDVCHDILSLHGNNRTNEPQVCVVCHNPNATDKSQRPAGGGVDGKAEEAIDFKTMIHAIHAGQASDGGFRETGIVIYGFNGSVNDFSDVGFPGKLNVCTTCHTDTSYQLAGIWAAPTANGVLGTTIDTGASATDPADNLRKSPTAAVCSSCHDSASAQTHMESHGANFSATQAVLDTGTQEGCATLCHGPGGAWDLKKVHNVP
jgi:OmcA/MtrC family decaheme c-type cytochrome